MSLPNTERRNVWVVLVLCIVSLGCERGSDKRAPAPAIDRMEAADRLLEAEMKRNRIPGLAAAVIENGVVRTLSYGVADIAARTPVSSHTAFQLASTTKSLVVTAVLRLVADGRLKLDDQVGAFVPDIPAAWRAVKIRQLLSHTSGLPDIVRTPGQLDLVADTWPDALVLVGGSPMQFAPGERWAYTQTNYVLLAKVVERISGMTFEAFMTAQVFEPLGMRDTFFPGANGSARTCATNYERGDGLVQRVRALSFPAFVHAAGGVCASVDDIVRWNAALDGGSLLPPALMKEMWTPALLNDGSRVRIDGGSVGYGLGWVVDSTPGQRWVGHSGGNSSALRKFVDSRLTIVVLHNGVLDPDGLVSSLAATLRVAPGGPEASVQDQLWDAAIAGDVHKIEAALNEGADIEALDTRRSKSGRRALNWAAWYDRAEAVRLLLSRGAAIEAENKTGFTALHHAAEAGSLNAAKVLLAAGADPRHVNRKGVSPADTARAAGHPEVAAMIEAAVAK